MPDGEPERASTPAHGHLTWLRCPTCRRPLVPLYVVEGFTVLEPTPHVQVIAAKITCPVDGAVINWVSELRIPQASISW